MTKFYLENWEIIPMCKDFGGLGIPNLRELNLCVLASWVKRYIGGESEIWKEMIDYT